MSNTNINKNLYKIFLSIVKYIPITLAILFITHNILVYNTIITPIILYIGGTSVITLTLLYLLSWIFKFCYLYRIPLHYVTLANLLGIIDKCLKLPFSNIGMYRLHFILFGIMLLVYIWYAYKNRHNPKVEPLDTLCETYCDCDCDK